VVSGVTQKRIEASRRDFLAYRVSCPVCGAAVGPRFVTREHLDVPPNPPYAASVVCPTNRDRFEVVFL
jgi:phage terminase large subunit GpA-like protein